MQGKAVSLRNELLGKEDYEVRVVYVTSCVKWGLEARKQEKQQMPAPLVVGGGFEVNAGGGMVLVRC